jgi:polysaccharide deacetylase family protein (PEP-CTERM system associated)
MKNLLTVDLEDWFSVETFNRVFAPDSWTRLESVVEPTTEKILNLFADYNVKATFFVLGWVAKRHPALVAAIAEAGHEIACHSFYHRMVSSLTPEEFREDTKLAFDAIVTACGRVPAGYRSPTWGIRQDMTWAFEILAELGFHYDSSIFPIHHDLYGDPNAPREAFEIRLNSGKKLVEVPASTLNFMSHRIPLGGGGWLRQFPYWFTKRGIKSLNRDGVPVMVYFHPWELEPGIPRVKLSFKNRIRQYGNLNTMEIKVKKLLDDFDFMTVGEYINELRPIEKAPKK